MVAVEELVLPVGFGRIVCQADDFLAVPVVRDIEIIISRRSCPDRSVVARHYEDPGGCGDRGDRRVPVLRVFSAVDVYPDEV